MTTLRHLSFLILLATVSAIASPLAFAQDEGPEVTRADLATAYLRLETALKDVDLDDAETARVNKAFDAATLAFFGGKMGEAIKQINELTASVLPVDDPLRITLPASMRVSVEPPVYVAGSDPAPTVRLQSLYPVIEGAIDRLHIRVTPLKQNGLNDDATFNANTANVPIPAEGFTHEMKGFQNFEPARYVLTIGTSDEEPGFEAGYWTIVPGSLDALAARYSETLKTIEASTPALEQALASCAARNRLLSDNPSPENTAHLLFDPNELANEVGTEIAALAKGENPYVGRKGDFWRVLKAGAKESPMRVYLPESADTSKPLPLVIAFHGAGGDENMFMDAYGAGIIKETADKHGFLLVTPRTYDYGGSGIGEMFDMLVEAIGYDYNIDPKRIYVLGHSMGGGATNNLINARPNVIAAAAPICGFRALTTSAEETPPTLVIAAEHDPLARPARVEPGAQKAIDEGLPVEYKLMKNYGHTLVVGDVMHDTIDWLLKHTRD